MKLDILAFAAHPDDAELSAGGTLLKHIDLGYKAGIIDLTRGELGTRGNEVLRLEEASLAKERMGLSVRENLALADGFIEEGKGALLSLISSVRRYRPSIVLCNALSDRHPDHNMAARLTARACYLSGLVKIDTGQDPWRPKSVYHYIQDNYIQPDLVVDISGYMDRKLEVVMSYRSQFYDPGSREPETPISSLAFLEFLKARGREMGRQPGFEFGEGFTASRHLGVKDLFAVI